MASVYEEIARLLGPNQPTSSPQTMAKIDQALATPDQPPDAGPAAFGYNLGSRGLSLWDPEGPVEQAVTQIGGGAWEGLRDLALQANQAMPWGGNDPSAIGIDVETGALDPNKIIPFATDVAGYAGTGAMAGGPVSGAAGALRPTRLASYPPPADPTLMRKLPPKKPGGPAPGVPVEPQPADWRTQPAIKGQEFYSKNPSPQELDLMKKIAAAQKAINAGNYTPYFDVSKRFRVDPSNYPATGTTVAVTQPKTAASIAKYGSIPQDQAKRQALIDAYNAGKDDPLAWGWYHMGQLENEFIKEYGPEEGRKQFKARFADAMAATTAGADPTGNLRMAGYGNYQHAGGQTAGGLPSHQFPSPVGGRYGASAALDMFDKIRAEGGVMDLRGNPKRHNFSRNFLGDYDPVTLDEQMSKILGHSSNEFGDPAYGPNELLVQQVAAELGIDPADLQGVAWVGAKKLKDKSYKRGKPMIEIVNEAIERTSQVTGLPPEEVMRGMVRGEIPIYSSGMPLPSMVAPEPEEEPWPTSSRFGPNVFEQFF